jgi:hypothetical protein
MRFKIRGGTVNHGDPPLCLTCRFAALVKGPRLRDDIVECSRLSGRITFPVHSCSSYADVRHASIREMEDIAWVLRSDPRRNSIGFVEARKLKAADRYVLQEEWD